MPAKLVIDFGFKSTPPITGCYNSLLLASFCHCVQDKTTTMVACMESCIDIDSAIGKQFKHHVITNVGQLVSPIMFKDFLF